MSVKGTLIETARSASRLWQVSDIDSTCVRGLQGNLGPRYFHSHQPPSDVKQVEQDSPYPTKQPSKAQPPVRGIAGSDRGELAICGF